jgi:biopolymer transport protein ExbD
MRFRRVQDDEPEVNLIPLIDIMLVVLIFLAVTTTYAHLSELRIDLSAASAEAMQEQPTDIVVGVTADGRYALQNTPLAGSDVESIAAALRQHAQGQTDALVVIQADARAPHQAVINVMEAARLAQLPRVAFVTERSTPAAK